MTARTTPIRTIVGREPAGVGDAIVGVVYEVSIKRSASPAVRACFPDCEITADRGVIRLRARLPDQAALYGVLDRIQDLALELLAVHVVAEANEAAAARWGQDPFDLPSPRSDLNDD